MWVTVIDKEKNMVSEEEHIDHEESGIEITAQQACEVRATALHYGLIEGQSILISDGKYVNPEEEEAAS